MEPPPQLASSPPIATEIPNRQRIHTVLGQVLFAFTRIPICAPPANGTETSYCLLPGGARRELLDLRFQMLDFNLLRLDRFDQQGCQSGVVHALNFFSFWIA